MGKALAPTLGKTLGLSVLADLASEGASQSVRKLSGGNIFTDMVESGRKLEKKKISGGQVGGFSIPQSKINQLITYKHLLSTKQKQDILNALQTGSGVHIKPTKTQLGNVLGTILASTGIPLAVELVKKNNWQRSTKIGEKYWKTRWPWSPSIGYVPTTSSFYWNMGTDARRWQKKRTKSSKKGQGLLLGTNSPFNNTPILGAIL